MDAVFAALASEPRRRVLDVALPVAAVVMCGGLLLHVGAWHLVLTGALAVAGLVLNRCSWRVPARGEGGP